MPSRLPKRLQAYWNLSVMAEHQVGVEHLLLLATMDRESTCGYGLQPQGPAGTGDWQPRLWHRYVDRADAERFRHWRPSLDEYERIMARHLDEGLAVPEFCMPADGLGWGRGLMQLDWADPENLGFLMEMLPTGKPAWQDAWHNIRTGGAKLQRCIEVFKGTEAPDFFGLCAYNAGAERVSKALLQVRTLPDLAARLDAVDRITTGHDYAADVLDRRTQYRRALSTPKEPDHG